MPRDVLDVATEAARARGRRAVARYGVRRPGWGPSRARPTSSPTPTAPPRPRSPACSRAAGPTTACSAEEGTANRDGTTGLRWVVDPLDGDRQLPVRDPAVVREHRLRGRRRHARRRRLRPAARELFSAVRGGPVRADGGSPREREQDDLAAAMIAGGVACATDAEAKRAGKLEKRLFRRVGARRALGTAALELAWTAAGRIDVCYHEQRIHPWDVDAGLFICQRAGLRVHRLEPLDDDLAPRFLAAPAGLAAEVLELRRPGGRRSAARRRASRAPLSVAERASARRDAPPRRAERVSRGRRGPRRPRVSTPARSTSRWVTARTVRGPSAPIRTPAALERRDERGRVADAEHDDVGLHARPASSATPSISARPSASARASAWSSASRSTWWSSAYSAPAATIPAWRIAPPSICLSRHASSISSREPGQAARRPARRGPCEKSSHAVSNPRVHSSARDAGGDHRVHQPRAVHVQRAARAPRATSTTARSCSSGHTWPPARFVVCSTDTSRERGEVAVARRPQRRRQRSAVNIPRSPVERVHHRARQRRRAARLGDDRVRGAVQVGLVAAGPRCAAERDLVAHRPDGQEHRRLEPEQLRHPRAQRVDRRVRALLLVADLGLGHRARASRRSAASGCRSRG